VRRVKSGEETPRGVIRKSVKRFSEQIMPNKMVETLTVETQLMRFQVWPPQNMPPKAQPWTLRMFGPFIAMVES